MNTKKLIAAVVAFAAAGSVFAADNTEYVDFSNVTTTRTRAEVRAELEQAYAQGQLNTNTEVPEVTRVASTRSRDEVRKEAILAARNGQVESLYFGS